MSDAPEYNTVAWGMLEGYPWWPVYVCDPTKLREKLHLLGSGHKAITKKAKAFPNDYRVVYYFQSHNFGLLKVKQLMRKWNCEDHEKFTSGWPKVHFKKKDNQTAEDLAIALTEAEDFLSQDESIRIPPGFVPSDLDPTLEPPPTPPPEEGEDDDDEADEDDDVPEDMDNDDDDGDVSDDDEKPIKPKKSKAEKKKKKKSTKEKSKEEKSTKEKSSKEKSTKRKSENKEEVSTKSSEKALKKRKSSEAKESKLSKRSSDSDVKEEKDVKKKKVASSIDEKNVNAAENSPKEDPDKDSKEPLDLKIEHASSDSENAALKKRLEVEIRLVLSTGNLETLTTRKVRKLLSEKLNMDLKDHKDTIKEVVNRIIAGLDPVAPVTLEADVSTLLEKVKTASGADVKIHLETLFTVADKLNADQISSISNLIGDLRSNEDSRVVELSKSLFDRWKLQEPSPDVEIVTSDAILALKAKLEDESTPNDDMLICLKQLSSAPMTLELIKQTKITIVVASLRQHVNDKVSTAAKDLRNKWKRDFAPTEATVNAPSGLGFMSKLETIRRVLEKDSGDDESLQSAQTVELKALKEMNLTTQQILDSQIGIVVSKLRKSKNMDLAGLANSLKNKWKEQANRGGSKVKST
ncbi:Aste57867_23476 [Aphanomyces stellatus]|uniref:Aste57867_23476 protein n=1 Tax=Aphanomyces stellatus TaxID=120398 RepID=A0A485LPN3_9STRA|nr:hypothetical protein As57867_023405 [Aphanomyces stellatus]VFU00121.1 Aste57867_23476 [Aphanomyces stellatus]